MGTAAGSISSPPTRLAPLAFPAAPAMALPSATGPPAPLPPGGDENGYALVPPASEPANDCDGAKTVANAARHALSASTSPLRFPPADAEDSQFRSRLSNRLRSPALGPPPAPLPMLVALDLALSPEVLADDVPPAVAEGAEEEPPAPPLSPSPTMFLAKLRKLPLDLRAAERCLVPEDRRRRGLPPPPPALDPERPGGPAGSNLNSPEEFSSSRSEGAGGSLPLDELLALPPLPPFLVLSLPLSLAAKFLSEEAILFAFSLAIMSSSRSRLMLPSSLGVLPPAAATAAATDLLLISLCESPSTLTEMLLATPSLFTLLAVVIGPPSPPPRPCTPPVGCRNDPWR
mmetsp:Transcript_7396/g.21808  ORF Transcript_7396/g.21808 Transcript_7396/m.21808 type:complete len:345 (-) Transcript_7396:225-1259(-)